MNITTEQTRPNPAPRSAPRHSDSAFRRGLEEVFGPVEALADPFEHRLAVARSAIGYAGLLATLVQVVVWLLIALVSGHLDAPWWLWTTGPAVAALAALSLVRRWHRWYVSEVARKEAGR
jgi:hypothetical protein